MRALFKGSLIQAQGASRYLRLLLFFLLLLGMGWAFWFNFERRFSNIAAEKSFLDESKLLTSQDRRNFLANFEAIQTAWGIRPLIHIRTAKLDLPSLEGRTLFIGVLWPPKNSNQPDTLIILPPLMKRALPPQTSFMLQEELVQCLKPLTLLPPANPGPCLNQILNSIHNLLS